MSKFLGQVQKGVQTKPHLILLYGTDGCGKSTFASNAPNPIFIGNEDGATFLDVAKMPPVKDWFSFKEQLLELQTEKHDYKTLVIDSLDWMELLLHNKICQEYKVKSINNAAGGFGAGLKEALNNWQSIKDTLNYLRDKRGMNIIIIAHAENIPFNDPVTQSTYDRYQLKIDKKAAAFFREYVDFVLFTNFETTTAKEGSKTRAFGDGVRMLYTERRPGFDAKSRVQIPFSMPLDWNEFEKALNPLSADKIKEQIVATLEEINDPKYSEAVMAYIEKNSSKLSEVLNRVRAKKIN